MEQQELYSLLEEMQHGAAALLDSLAIAYETKPSLIWGFSNCAFWYFPRGVGIYDHAKPCIQMFIVTLLIIAKTWKKSRCSSVGECVKILEHLDNGYHSQS